MRALRLRLAVGLLVLAAIALTTVAWVQTLSAAPVTGPRVFEVEGAVPSEREAPFTGCMTPGRFHLLVVEEVVWTVCNQDGMASRLVRMDLESKRANRAYPFPEGLEVQTVTGLAVRDDRVLFVYSVEDDTTAAAIADSEGWVRAPHVIAPPAHSPRLRGTWPATVIGAWPAEGGFEVVLGDARLAGEALLPLVIAIGESADQARAPFASGSELCGPDAWMCKALATIHRGTTWSYVLEVAGDGGVDNVELTASGDRMRLDWPEDVNIQSHVDFGSSGAISDPFGNYELQEDGSIRPGLEPPFEPGWSRQWRATETGVELVPRSHEGVEVSAQHTGADWVVFDERERVISARRLPSEESVPVFRREMWCGLEDGVLVPRAGSGSHLVSASGCYVALRDDLTRADPLTLMEHLERSGSRRLGSRDEDTIARLGFLLFGLPLALLLGVLALFFAPWRIITDVTPSRDKRLLIGLGLGSAGFLALGWAALERVLPLLG